MYRVLPAIPQIPAEPMLGLCWLLNASGLTPLGDGETRCKTINSITIQQQLDMVLWHTLPSTSKNMLSLFPYDCTCGLARTCRVMQQYLEKGADGRRPMDSILNFPMYYKLNEVFATQKDMKK